MNTVNIFFATIFAIFFWTSTGWAAQQAVQTSSGLKVVHTRLIPVLMHRAVPPFAGKHVYQGRAR